MFGKNEVDYTRIGSNRGPNSCDVSQHGIYGAHQRCCVCGCFDKRGPADIEGTKQRHRRRHRDDARHQCPNQHAPIARQRVGVQVELYDVRRAIEVEPEFWVYVDFKPMLRVFAFRGVELSPDEEACRSQWPESICRRI